MKTWVCSGIKKTDAARVGHHIGKDYAPKHKLCPAAVKVGVDVATGKTQFVACTCECH